MDNLRLILIIAGVVLLAGIYVWGVAVARRRDAPPAADEYRETPEDELESVLDVRAAENVEALGNLENFDIDEDLERDVPAGDPLRQRRPDPADVESEENEISAEGTAEIDAGSETEDEPGVPVPEDDEIPDLADIDFEPGADDLEGIRATRTADVDVPIGQLDLLRLDDDEEEFRAVPPEPENAAPPKETKTRAGGEVTALAVTVMAREGQRFAGADLRRGLKDLGLEHGEMGIYHRRERGKSRRAPPQFSVANVVKPGTFDPDAMDDMSTPGVAMFVQLPGPDDPSAAFEEMIRAARKLAGDLDGVVCDDTRSTLTGQVINHMRERISEFSRRQRLKF